jgi:hypothetical protein
MTSIIENAYFEFHSSALLPISNIVNENEKFGIISLKIKKTNIINTPTLFLFTIDTTGSMDEPAYKNITKLQVVKQTFRSMMNYLSKLETQVFVRVDSFNETVNNVIDNILISQDNVNEIISKIDALYSDRSTNIGEALKQANNTMKQYSIENPEHQVVHIFMTDGQPTSGITNTDELVKIVDTKFTNNFVGFGFDHNALLLQKLSDLENSEYLFVDNMENTTLIYGEIIHRYLYSAIKNAEFVIENGVIYNWKTNTWDSKLIEPIIVSEIEKYYHIKTTNIADINIKLYGVNTEDNNNSLQLLDVIDILPDLIQLKEKNNEDNSDEYKSDDDDVEIVPVDLSKYMFRQRTQELLFKSKNAVCENYHKKQEIKTELKNFFKIMRDYMKNNNLTKDKFMITLCDDICITYRSYGTEHGVMYTTSRSASQGRQQTYNVTPAMPKLQRSVAISQFPPPPLFSRSITGRVLPTFSEEIPENWRCLDDEEGNHEYTLPIPNMMRTTNNLTQEFIEDNRYFDMPPRLTDDLFVNTSFGNNNENDSNSNSDNIDDYELSNDNTSCYATEAALNTMRSMSQM